MAKSFKFAMGASVLIAGVAVAGRVISQTHNDAIAFKPAAPVFVDVESGLKATAPGEVFTVRDENGTFHGYKHEKPEDEHPTGESIVVGFPDAATEGEYVFEEAEDTYTLAVPHDQGGMGFYEIERGESALTPTE